MTIRRVVCYLVVLFGTLAGLVLVMKVETTVYLILLAVVAALIGWYGHILNLLLEDLDRFRQAGPNLPPPWTANKPVMIIPESYIETQLLPRFDDEPQPALPDQPVSATPIVDEVRWLPDPRDDDSV
jgi:hypothetical protein